MLCKVTSAQTVKKLQNDTVVWRADYHLQFEDFKGKRPARGVVAAAAQVGILFHVKEIDGEMVFIVEAIFVKSKSFIKDSSQYSLNHEQIHFDITELYTRKMRKKLQSINYKKVKNMQSEINKVYDNINQDLRKEQEEYDKDTEHGINMVKQKMWAEKINKEILELEEFSDPQVHIE